MKEVFNNKRAKLDLIILAVILVVLAGTGMVLRGHGTFHVRTLHLVWLLDELLYSIFFWLWPAGGSRSAAGMSFEKQRITMPRQRIS